MPFFVAIYSRLFGAQFFYHIQDIHPEILKKIINEFKKRMHPGKKGFLFTFPQVVDIEFGITQIGLSVPMESMSFFVASLTV